MTTNIDFGLELRGREHATITDDRGNLRLLFRGRSYGPGDTIVDDDGCPHVAGEEVYWRGWASDDWLIQEFIRAWRDWEKHARTPRTA